MESCQSKKVGTLKIVNGTMQWLSKTGCSCVYYCCSGDGEAEWRRLVQVPDRSEAADVRAEETKVHSRWVSKELTLWFGDTGCRLQRLRIERTLGLYRADFFALTLMTCAHNGRFPSRLFIRCAGFQDLIINSSMCDFFGYETGCKRNFCFVAITKFST